MVSPSPELTRLAGQVARELGERLEIHEGILDEGVRIAGRLEEKGISAIISRAPTGVMIRKQAGIPVVLVEITGFDVLAALHRARAEGRRALYLGYEGERRKYDWERIQEILGAPAERAFYRTREELENLVREAARSGVTAVVGTGMCIEELAAGTGMKTVLVGSSREAVIAAIQRAKDVVELMRRDREVAQRLTAILDLAYDGIVVADEKGHVMLYNPTAEKILKVRADDVIGRPLESHPVLAGLLGKGRVAMGEVRRVGEHQLVVNRAPVESGGDNMGYVLTFQRASKLQTLEQKVRAQLYAKGLLARFSFDDVIGQSPVIRQCVETARKFAAADSTVLLTGESGTGKELFAQSIHLASRRRGGPFVAVNCAALPENLLESELFGYEEGAFTGARRGGKPGLFELAHGGTIFLDEIGEMPLPLQARLLRVIQERELMRLGGDRVIPVDVRIVAAANDDLEKAVREKRFREDLYFRLEVLALKLPPLRHRKEDLLLLANSFAARLSERLGRKVAPLDARSARPLMEYGWPGNVRELENLMEKYAILYEPGEDPLERISALMEGKLGRSGGVKGVPGPGEIVVKMGPLEEIERQVIEQVTQAAGGKVTESARLLGISRTTAWRKLRAAR